MISESELPSFEVRYGNGVYPIEELVAWWVQSVAVYVEIAETKSNPRQLDINHLTGDLWLRQTIADELARNEHAPRASKWVSTLCEADRRYRGILTDQGVSDMNLSIRLDFDDEGWRSRAWWWRGVPRNLDA